MKTLKQSEWKDRDIKELIKKLPAIKDDRHPNFIYSRILQENNKNLIVFKRFIPTMAAIIALCIVVLLSPTIVDHLQSGQNNEKSMDKAHRK